MRGKTVLWVVSSIGVLILISLCLLPGVVFKPDTQVQAARAAKANKADEPFVASSVPGEPDTPTTDSSRAARAEPSTKLPTRPGPAASLASQEAATTVTRLLVRGTVFHPASQPVAGASVDLWDIVPPPSGENFVMIRQDSTTTGPDGRFELKSNADGPFVLDAWTKGAARNGAILANGHEPLRFKAADKSTSNIVMQDLLLGYPARVAGRVVDSEGNGIANAALLALRIDDFYKPHEFCRVEAASDSDGAFAIEDFSAGEIILLATAPGYLPASVVRAAPVDSLAVVLSRGGASVTGHVFHRQTGEGISDAEVWLDPVRVDHPALRSLVRPNRFPSDTTGAFRITQAASGEYRVGVYKRGLFYFHESPTEQKTITLAAGQTLQGLELFLYDGHTIQGCVVEKGTDTPIPGAKIFDGHSSGRKPFAKADDQGRFSFNCEWQQSGRALRAEKEGYALVPTGRHNYVQVALPTDRFTVETTLEMEKAAQVRGVVKQVKLPGIEEGKEVEFVIGDQK